MKNQALSSLELPENVITYHMISIEKDTIAAITNSNSGVICSQGHYHKTCPSNSKLFHSFIIICETTYIKLRKKEDQLYQQQQQINHTTPTSLKTWDYLQNYQQKPRKNGQDMDKSQAPFQAMLWQKQIATATFQFLQV